VQDSMVNSLMMRHRTLSDTNKTLLQNLIEMGDEVWQCFVCEILFIFHT